MPEFGRLRRIADHPINRIAHLLTWNLFPANPPGTEMASFIVD